jgi:hypothetical protein
MIVLTPSFLQRVGINWERQILADGWRQIRAFLKEVRHGASIEFLTRRFRYVDTTGERHIVRMVLPPVEELEHEAEVFYDDIFGPMDQSA